MKVEELTITCSDKSIENSIKTMKENKEMVTKGKKVDEAYVPIVRNRLLSLEAGANLSYVQTKLVLDAK